MSNPPHPENGSDAPSGPVPAENLPGHHPVKEQDRPNLDAFAERLGVVDASQLDDAEDRSAAPTEPAAGRRIPTPAVVGIVAALVSVVLAVLAGQRHRRSR